MECQTFPKQMRAIIVDDNQIDRLNLNALLEDHEGIQIVGEAATLESAVALIEKAKPDVVFLDIHLGKDNGFTALEKISYKPKVVITSSHSHYAVRGFEIEAVDYLLKPILEETLARAIRRLLPQTSTQPAPRLEPDDMQMFRHTEGWKFVRVADILAITGERIYSSILLRDGKTYLHNRPLREWKQILPEKIFKMLDRSTIVNLREIKNVSDSHQGRYQIIFQSSSTVLSLGEAAMKTFRGLM